MDPGCTTPLTLHQPERQQRMESRRAEIPSPSGLQILPAAPGAVQSHSQSFPNPQAQAQGRLQDPGPAQDGRIRMW